LSSFNPRKIKTNPTVSTFYKTIPEIAEEDVKALCEKAKYIESGSEGSSSSAKSVSSSSGGGASGGGASCGLKVVKLGL
jgi:uncharacterized membrane protein YgcG